MKYINDYHEGDKFAGVYLCKTKNTLKTKAGKNYYSLLLQDKTSSVDAKVWELNHGIDNFEAMDYIYVEGQVTMFQGTIQINCSRIRKAAEGEYVPADYIPCSKKDIQAMYKELVALINSISDDKMKELLRIILVNDKAFVNEFTSHSAAKTVHHGFFGGLLEHTLGVTKMCDFFCTAYPVLNRDLLLAAAMLHDIGKIEEIASFPQNDYTDDGQLLGHIFIGAEKIGRVADSIPGFSPKVASELKHCILAHHGKLEFGSPKVPALAEAFALSLADNADAKLESVTELFDHAGDNNDWLGYQRNLESNIRKTTKLN